MATRTVYFAGGFDATKPAQNQSEQWDTASGYTRWGPDGAVVETRALTNAETAALAQDDQQSTAVQNRISIEAAVRNALATNRTYAGLASPTAAQTAAQVKALSQQMNALIRLTLGQLDATN